MNDDVNTPIVSEYDQRFKAAVKQIMDLVHDRPQGGYRVVYADCPWLFRNWSNKGAKRGALRHYPCMSTELLCKLPVGLLAGPDSVLLFWAVWPMIFDAEKVMKAWGFEYKGLAWEWIKYNPNTDKYFFGMGYGSRKNLEPCLLASRGNPKCYNNSVRDHILPEDETMNDSLCDPVFSRKREHSRKPDEAVIRIEKMFIGPYIEVFGRTDREGWSVWGNETDKYN